VQRTSCAAPEFLAGRYPHTAADVLKSLEVPASLPESPAADDLEGWKKAWGENEALHQEENDTLRFTFYALRLTHLVSQPDDRY